MTDITLKPCPFCGGPAKVLFFNGTDEAGCGGDRECPGTDVLVPIAAWNTRALPQPEGDEGLVWNEVRRQTVRDVFAHMLYRAANNYHADPAIDAVCDEENGILQDLADDMLNHWSPEDAMAWRDISKETKRAKQAEARIAELEGALRREVEKWPQFAFRQSDAVLAILRGFRSPDTTTADRDKGDGATPLSQNSASKRCSDEGRTNETASTPEQAPKSTETMSSDVPNDGAETAERN